MKLNRTLFSQVVDVPEERAARLAASGLFERVALPSLKLKTAPSPAGGGASAGGSQAGSPATSVKAHAPSVAGGSKAGAATGGGGDGNGTPALAAKAAARPRRRASAGSPQLSRKARHTLEAELSERSDTDDSAVEQPSSSSEEESSGGEDSDGSGAESGGDAAVPTCRAAGMPAKPACKAVAAADASDAEEGATAQKLARRRSFSSSRQAKRVRKAAEGSGIVEAHAAAERACAEACNPAEVAGKDADGESGSISDDEPLAAGVARRQAARGTPAKVAAKVAGKAVGKRRAVESSDDEDSSSDEEEAEPARQQRKQEKSAAGKGEAARAMHVIATNSEISGEWVVRKNPVALYPSCLLLRLAACFLPGWSPWLEAF